jgi:hypothetical protein
MSEDANGWTPEQLVTLADDLRPTLRDRIDSKTDEIFAGGISWNGMLWYADKTHFDDYIQAYQSVMSGAISEIIIHGIGENAYVILTTANAQSFYNAGAAFKLNTLYDGYKLKDLGGTLSTGQTVTALKDLNYYELVTWTDPRI